MKLHATKSERLILSDRCWIRRVSRRTARSPVSAPSGCCSRGTRERVSLLEYVARRLRMRSAVVACAISGASSAAGGDKVITILPPTPQQMIAPACKVEVCCKSIVGVDTSPNVPPQCNGWTIVDGAWGPIDTYCGPYSNGHPDWQFPPLPCADTASGTNCATCDCIRDVMCRIELCCVRYEVLPELYGFNSNSSAFTAIDACQPSSGGPQPLPIPAPPLGAPGWSVLIPLANCPSCPQ